MKAIQLDLTHFPHSIQYVNCLLNLGTLYEKPFEEVQQYLKGIQICSTHFPRSIEYVACL